MDGYSGFVFACTDQEEAETLSQYIERNISYSVGIDNRTTILQFGKAEMCFFSYDDKHLHYAALMRWSNHVLSGKYSLKFFHSITLSTLPLTDSDDPLFPPADYKQLKPYMLRTSSIVEARMPSDLWMRLVAYVKQQRPGQSYKVDELERLRLLSNQRFTSIGYNTVKQEKEATLLALKIFGADYKDILSDWVTKSDQAEPYLQRLIEGNRVYEDNAIQNDIISSAKQVVPQALLSDFESSVRGLFRIKKENGDTLSMINVNRTEIEGTTGADLVYYDHTYRSHVMIQYKMMTTEEIKRKNEKGKNGQKKMGKDKQSDRVYYYEPKKQFYDQIDRMKCFLQTTSESDIAVANVQDYRLDSHCFYFKLCEPYEFKPVSESIADGN